MINRAKKGRARDFGLEFSGVPGSHNAITDVDGVLVGYETLSSHNNSALETNGIPIQTGVTAILPRGTSRVPKPVWAGIHAFNGNGEMTGSHWIRDGGYFVGPVMITNSHSVGAVHDAATRWIIDTYADAWHDNHLWAMPVVAETYDGVLNDINGQHVRPEHAYKALQSAKAGHIAEGNVGGGAGMICYEFKGGTGTASRQIEIDGQTFLLGVLVQANHGLRPWLKIQGQTVGPQMMQNRIPGIDGERGSIIAVLATDMPLQPLQLNKLARRGAIGIGRGGTAGGNNSGDIFLAFSTANEMELPQLSGPWRQFVSLNDELLDAVYMAAIDAIEEAIVNAMVAAEPVPTARPAGHFCQVLDIELLKKALRN